MYNVNAYVCVCVYVCVYVYVNAHVYAYGIWYIAHGIWYMTDVMQKRKQRYINT